jgi:PEP-CTERM motif
MLRMFFLLVLLTCSASLVKADPFVIDSGFFSFSGQPGQIHTSGSFAGGGFSAALGSNSFSGGVPSFQCPFGINECAPGNSISLSANSGPLDGTELHGSFSMNGQQYFFEFPSGGAGFSFVTDNVMIPFGNDPMITLTAPFFFRGDVRGGPFLSPVFAQLTGRGTAYLSLTLDSRTFPDGPHYGDAHITYQFQPVPEPASLLMLGTGLGLAGMLRRRFSAGNE